MELYGENPCCSHFSTLCRFIVVCTSVSNRFKIEIEVFPFFLFVFARASLALMIYREMIGAGLAPSMELLSQVLGCLQLPKDVSLKKRLIETLGINSETSRGANLFPLIDGFAEYDPRAFSLFEVSFILTPFHLPPITCLKFCTLPCMMFGIVCSLHLGVGEFFRWLELG